MKIRYINAPQNLFAEKRKNISAKTYANLRENSICFSANIFAFLRNSVIKPANANQREFSPACTGFVDWKNFGVCATSFCTAQKQKLVSKPPSVQINAKLQSTLNQNS